MYLALELDRSWTEMTGMPDSKVVDAPFEWKTRFEAQQVLYGERSSGWSSRYSRAPLR